MTGIRITKLDIEVRNLGQPPRATVVFNGIIVDNADPDTALAFRDGNTTPEQEEALQKAFEDASIPKPWLDQLFTQAYKEHTNAASAKPKDTNHAGWNYYATANIIGFKQYPSVPQQCPGRDLLIQCVTSPDKTITDTDRATLHETMEWMVNNTFSGQLDQTIEAAFKILPADLVQEFLNSDTMKYRQIRPRPAHQQDGPS